MDPKQKLIFGIVAGACTAAIIALAALLFGQIGAKNEAKEARDNAASEIRGYYSEAIYPSKANRDIREQDTKTYTEVAEAARALLAKPLEYPKGESPSQFVTRVADTIHALDARKNASRVEIFDGIAKNKNATPAEQGMDYSFGRYVQQGELPKDTDVPRLAHQFAVIEHVCDILLDAGALDITKVTREMFDTAAKPVQEDKNARRTTRRSKAKEEPVATTGVQLPDELAKDGVTAEAFTITFRAQYATIAKVMNTLAKDSLFVVVTDVSFNNPMDLRTRVADMVKRRESARATAARRNRNRAAEENAEPVKEVALFETAAPAERLVTDPENAMPMEVSISFEVYSVPPAEEPEAETAETDSAKTAE
jgi:hypothetical protein